MADRTWISFIVVLMAYLGLNFTTDSGVVTERAPHLTNWMDQLDLNLVIDQLIPNITQQFVHWNLEPLFFGNLHSQDLSDCWIHGLTSVYRSGNCYILSVDPETTFVVISIGFKRISGTCKFDKRILFRYRGIISMQMRNITSVAQINQVMRDDAHPTLQYLDVEIPSNMEVEAYGSGAVSLIVDTLELLYKRRLRQLVRITLLEKLENLIGQYLNQITLNDINDAFYNQRPQDLFNASLIQLNVN